MTPRLTTSKQWSNIPQEFREKAGLVFKQNFVNEVKAGDFRIDGRIYKNEIVLRGSYIEKGRLKQTNFEVSMDHSPDQKAMDKLFLGIDVLGSVFETHFDHLMEEEEDDIEYPLFWEEHEFDDTKVFLRYSTENTDLEEAANRILGVNSDGLYQDPHETLAPSEAEDALLRAEIDAELANEVSEAIRNGTYVPKGHEAIDASSDKSPDDLH